MNHTDREIDRLCLDVILLDGEQDEAPDLSDMATRAKAILAKREQDRRFARNRPRSSLAPGKSKAERKAERFQRASLIREAVFKRSDAERQGRCEWYCELPATDWHHVLGAGGRRTLERVDNTCAICRECHRAYERSELATLKHAEAWAVNHSFTAAAQAITKRIDKVLEARAQHPEHERVGTR